MIDQRIVEILLEQTPDELYSKIASRVKYLMRDEISDEHLQTIEQTEDRIHSRIEFLRESYLLPKANITPNWKKKGNFQIYLDGMGSYWLEFKTANSRCDESFVHANIEIGRTRQRQALSKCVNGRLKSRRVLVSEKLIERKEIKLTKSSNNRFMLGGLLLTVRQGDVVFKDMTLTNNNLTAFSQTKLPKKYMKIPVKENWPFRIKVDPKTKVVSLGTNAQIREFENNGGAVTFRNVIPNSGRLPFKRQSKQAAAFSYTPSDKLAYKTLGPLICWTLEDDSSCFEINEAFLGGFKNKPAAPVKPAAQRNTFTRQIANACDASFTFEAQTYHIPQSVSVSKNCAIAFTSNASLVFGPGASLVIEGPATFPDTGTISFTGLDGGSWGGVVFKGQKEMHIQNIFMSHSTEFTWNDRYFTSAMNLLNVEKSSIKNSIFRNIDADDALNVRGGVSTITQNIFEKNRDGLDMDLGTGLVSGNIFIDHLDDGIDLGSAGPIDIRNNVIIGSGDKGVSVGEESSVIVSSNILFGNNIGLANKDGSQAALNDNFYRKNNIGLSVYKKNVGAADVSPVDGKSFFKDNNVDFKREDKNITSSKLVKPYGADEDERRLLEEILSSFTCDACEDYTKKVRGRL